MKFWTITEIAESSDVPIPTVSQMVKRGALPAPEIRAGRCAFYSEESGRRILWWLRTQYVRQARDHRMEGLNRSEPHRRFASANASSVEREIPWATGSPPLSSITTQNHRSVLRRWLITQGSA
jgi:hypothetical protein